MASGRGRHGIGLRVLGGIPKLHECAHIWYDAFVLGGFALPARARGCFCALLGALLAAYTAAAAELVYVREAGCLIARCGTSGLGQSTGRRRRAKQRRCGRSRSEALNSPPS